MRRKKHRYIRNNGTHWRNLIFIIFSIIAAIYLLRNDSFHAYLLHLGRFEYIGAFIAGIFFVSTFTIVPASVVLFLLSESLPVWSIAVLAGFGGMVGDFVLYRLVRNEDIALEVNDVFTYFGGRKIRHVLHSKHFRWMVPVIGAIIIASPLPDEIGVSLLGISKLPPKYFLLTTWILDTFGVLLMLSLSLILKP